MKRGDVVRTGEELLALPVGSEVVDMDARRFKTVDKGAFPCDALGLARVVYPALVRVVGPVEPEWLRTAALAAASALPLASLADEAWGRAAKAAVAAADKARGIVNSREELNAYANECRQAGKSFVFTWPEIEGVEPIYPAVVRPKR